MRCLLILALCVAAVAAEGDLLCRVFGTLGCNINCIASGSLNGGTCENGNECMCKKGDSRALRSVNPEARSFLYCMLGGDWGCRIKCLINEGKFNGYCDGHTCHCTEKPSADARSSLICLLGGDLACQINCLTSKGNFEGHCDKSNDCQCKHRPTPEARNTLSCQIGGDNTCAAFCHWTTGVKGGKCDADNNCVCDKSK